jgi:coenzyme PQQ precursor peptide PqqA
LLETADPWRRVCGACLTGRETKETAMAWTTPVLEEICIGLEINGYLPIEL